MIGPGRELPARMALRGSECGRYMSHCLDSRFGETIWGHNSIDDWEVSNGTDRRMDREIPRKRDLSLSEPTH